MPDIDREVASFLGRPMSLRDTLDECWRQASPDVRAAYDALVRDLAARDLTSNALKAGDSLPPFELPNVEGKFVSSADLAENGPVVVSFFRGGWCPYCTSALRALEGALPDIERFGATLIAITPDTGAALAAAKQANTLSYNVLSDVDFGVSLTFGLVFRVPDAIRELYIRRGIDLGARHGNSVGPWLLPIPATYVVHRGGIIRHSDLDVDFRRRMEPAEIVRILQTIDRG
jgi:peroxiredoxin